MLRRSLRTLFSVTPSRSLSPYSIFTAKCSTSSPPRLTYPHSFSHPDPRNVRVSVWWDIDNCNVPSGVNVYRGAQAITTAIESSGIKGPIDIKAYGDTTRLANTSKISSTGIHLTHIPHESYSKGDSAVSFLFNDLIRWSLQNPPPAHLFLITLDGGYPRDLHQLRMNNYNILLASKESAHVVVRSAATIMWDWDALVRGENLTGRYFKQPPGFWYGRYEGPLEDPFTEIKRPAFAPDDQPGELQTHEVKEQGARISIS